MTHTVPEPASSSLIVPVVLSPEEVERVFAIADRSIPRGRRDYAILLLLARLRGRRKWKEHETRSGHSGLGMAGEPPSSSTR